MKVLMFDTETTGVPNYDLPLDDKRQPRIAQISLAMIDDDPGDDIIVSMIDAYTACVKPDGWQMPPYLPAKLKNGLTQEYLEANGVPMAYILHRFFEMYDEADIIAAYGIKFDSTMIKIEATHYGMLERLSGKKVVCVQKMAIDPCAIPPTETMLATGRDWYKTPNLGEATRILLNRELSGAHGARADCLATAEIYMKLKRQKERANA